MQRIIGIVLGAVVTYLALVLPDATSNPEPKYGTAVILGAVVSLLWPWVIGFILVSRAKQRSNQVDKEVDKRMAEEHNNPS